MRDSLLIFGDGNLVTTGAEDSTDTLDLANVDKGEGTVLWWHVLVDTVFATGTSCVFTLADSPDDSTWRSRISSDVILAATLVLGYEYIVGIHWDTQRYLKVITTAVGTFDTGSSYASWIEID